MQQYLTLEDAAKLLHISNDELREMAKKKTIRAFQDRGSWRFRLQDIEEEARKRGQGSDHELALGDTAPKPSGEDRLPADFSLDDDEVPLGREKSSSGPASGRSSGRHAKTGSDSDVRLVLDSNMEIALNNPKAEGSASKSPPRKKTATADSGVRLVPSEPAGDSDVKVVPSSKDSGVSKSSKSPSDSDIRLHDADPGKKKGDAAGIITEEIDLDAEEAKLKEEVKKSQSGVRPRKVTQAAPPLLPSTSPFEISESDVDVDTPSKSKSRKDTDSSSDFELVPFDASKQPVDLGSGEIPLLPDSDEISFGAEVSGPNAGNSGINLEDPADSGISLEDGSSAEIEFELSLDAGSTPKPAKAKTPEKKVEEDSSSEFELSLDDSSPTEDDSDSEFELSLEDSGDSSISEGSDSEFELTLDDEGGIAVDDEAGDIFEDTNFDVPSLDDESGSQAVELDDETGEDSSSDFEISMDEEDSGSQVVNLDDEEADEGAATVAKPRKAAAALKGKAKPAEDEDLDLDEEDEPAPAKKGKKKPAPVVDEDEDEDDEERAAPAAAEWDALPAVLLFPTVAVMFVVALMGFEMIRGMWGYHRPSVVGKPVIDTIARQFDESLPK